MMPWSWVVGIDLSEKSMKSVLLKREHSISFTGS
jgi:hypothetical protein